MKWITEAWNSDGTPMSPAELREFNLKLQTEDDARWRKRQAEDPEANEKLTHQLGL